MLSDLANNISEADCKKYFPGNGCSLPMLPGYYGSASDWNDTFVWEMFDWHDRSSFNSFILDDLKKAMVIKLKPQINIRAADGSDIICLKTKIAFSGGSIIP